MSSQVMLKGWKTTLAILIIELITISLLGCSAEQTHLDTFSNEPIAENYRDVVEIRRTHIFGADQSEDEREVWGEILNISQGPNGSILAVDNKQIRGYIVSPFDSVITIIGYGIGSGPGEFRNLTALAWGKGHEIFALEGTGGRISIFTERGNYLRSFYPTIIVWDILAGVQGQLWLRPWRDTTIDRLLLVDSYDGHVLNEIGGRYSESPWNGKMRTDPSLAVSPVGFFMAVPYPYDVCDYSFDGRLIRCLGRKAKWMKPPRKSNVPIFGDNLYPYDGSVRSAACFPNGFILVALIKTDSQVANPSGFPEFQTVRLFDLFNSESNWLTTIPETAFASDAQLKGPFEKGTMHLTCPNGHKWKVWAEYSITEDYWRTLLPNRQSDTQCPECGEYSSEKEFELDID